MHVLILGGSASDRQRAARARITPADSVVPLDTPILPFVRPTDVALPPSPRVILLHDVDRAFVDAQRPGTRLVLTQSTYLMQAWIDALADGDRVIATADRAALERNAPEAFQGRGPWLQFEVVQLDNSPGVLTTEDTKDTKENNRSVSTVSSVVNQPSIKLLAGAYQQSDAVERLRLCRDATLIEPESAVAWLALASASREVQDIPAAREALDRAAALAPDWEAMPYERGKLWLAYDDTEHARDEFRRATDLMPTFSSAFSNLGAALGELDDTEGALAAFERALAHDPNSFTILNNVGVVSRELGRFDESAAALRRVVALAPDFVFGYYNLGHTLFLAGAYREALAAYEEGRRRDPMKNARQGCRLAVTRLAAGDAAGAERDLWHCVHAAPPDDREDLLLEAYEIVHALLAAHPALTAHRPFLDRLAAEIAKSE